MTLGRWCGTCKCWVVMSERTCPSCRNRLRAPEAMPADAHAISTDAPDPNRARPLAISGIGPDDVAEPRSPSGAEAPSGTGGEAPATWYPKPERPSPDVPANDPPAAGAGSSPPRRGPSSPPTSGGWDPQLPPIPGVDDLAGSDPAAGGLTAPAESIDGIPRNVLVAVLGAAAALFVVGLVVLSSGGSGSDGPPEGEVASPGPEFEDHVAFSPPPTPERPPLEDPILVPHDQWDPVVADLIGFIEENRRLRFTKTVDVHVLSTEELFAEFNVTDVADPFIEEELRFVTAIYRSLGIYEGEIDAAAFIQRSRQVGVTGLYDPSIDAVYINHEVGADDSGPGRSPFQRAVLVHELTHALQDQHVDLTRRASGLDLFTMQLLMIEGDARRVERAYVESLSPEEQDQYWSAMGPLVSHEGIDGVLGIEGEFIYEGGLQVNRLVDVLAGLEQVDVLMRYPPDRPAQLLRASTLFLQSEEPWNQSGPSARRPQAPPGAFPMGGGSFGAWLWYVTLAARVDGADALRAADAISSDAFTLYEQDGAICGAFVVAANDRVDLGHLARGLWSWAEALPHGARLEIEGQFITVNVCDPGADAAMAFARTPDDIVSGPIARTGAVAAVLERQRGWWADDPLRERERWCLTESVQRVLTLAEVADGLSDDRIDELGEGAVTACLAGRVPGGPPPFDGDCSAAGSEVDLDDEGLPDEVVATRRALVDAATGCDFAGLRDPVGSGGKPFGDGELGQPTSGRALVERWGRVEERRRPVLADLVATLDSSWMCGPDLAAVVEDGSGEACVFISAGSGAVARDAHVAVIAFDGTFLGFGANRTVQEAALERWAETAVEGDRSSELTTPAGPLPGPLPADWPVAVPAATLINR
jgi:hypothetical protein